MGRSFFLAAALIVLWFLLSGYFDVPLLIAFGVLSVAASVWLARRAGAVDEEGVPVELGLHSFSYFAWLFLEIGKANVVVARQALAITPRLSPTMIRVPAHQRTDAGRMVFGQSITLTPGTVTVDFDKECVLVHALTEELADLAALEDMGARVCRIEADVPLEGER